MVFKQFFLVFAIFVLLSACVKFLPLEEKNIAQLPAFSEATADEKNYVFVKSRDLKQMNDVIVSFIENYPDIKVSILNLEGEANEEKVANFLKAKTPVVIICLGSLAARTTIRVEKKTPIVFAMVVNYKRYPELRQTNVTGIAMEIPPISLFTQFKMLMPEVDSIGVPFHPSVSSEILSDATNASQKMGVQLVKIAIANPNNIMASLSASQTKDYAGLWMLADTKLYNRKTDAINKLTHVSGFSF